MVTTLVVILTIVMIGAMLKWLPRITIGTLIIVAIGGLFYGIYNLIGNFSSGSSSYIEVLILVLVVAIAIITFYLLFFRGKKTPTPNPQKTTEEKKNSQEKTSILTDGRKGFWFYLFWLLVITLVLTAITVIAVPPLTALSTFIFHIAIPSNSRCGVENKKVEIQYSVITLTESDYSPKLPLKNPDGKNLYFKILNEKEKPGQEIWIQDSRGGLTPSRKRDNAKFDTDDYEWLQFKVKQGGPTIDLEVGYN